MSNRKGFTLIELLIVVVIIGILAAIAIPKFASTKEKAYISAMKSDLRNLATSQEAWFADNTVYFGGPVTTAAPFPAGCTPGGANPCIYTPSVGVTVNAIPAPGGWSATAVHAQAPARNCAIFVGVAAVAPATVEGEPRCN